MVKHRHVIAPILGIGVIGLVAGLTGLTTLAQIGFAVVLGGVVWIGAELVLAPSDPFAALKRAKAVGDVNTSFIARELEQANGRVARIRKARHGLKVSTLGNSVGRICDSAEAIIGDVTRNPKDFRRMRKPLAHYLDHVETIVDRYAYLASLGPVESATHRRIADTVTDLERVFVEYQRRMVEDETGDIDARLELLEREIEAEGIARTGRRGATPADMPSADPR